MPLGGHCTTTKKQTPKILTLGRAISFRQVRSSLNTSLLSPSCVSPIRVTHEVVRSPLEVAKRHDPLESNKWVLARLYFGAEIESYEGAVTDGFWNEVSVDVLVQSGAFQLSPATAMRVTRLPGGLLIPEKNVPQQILDTSAQYATMQELLGVSLTVGERDRILKRHARLDLVAAASALIAELYPVGHTDEEVQESLADRKFVGEARDRAKKFLELGHRVIVSPQVALNALKVILLNGVEDPIEDGRDSQADAFILALGLADFHGMARATEGEDRWWDVMPMSTAMELTRNHSFNSSFDPAAIIGRWWRMREIAQKDFPAETATFDDLFREATGTSLEVLFSVGAHFFFQMLESQSVAISRGLLSQLEFSEEELDNALKLMSATADTIAADLEIEVETFGFGWSFNTLRRFSVI